MTRILLTFFQLKEQRKSILGLFSGKKRSLYWSSTIPLIRKRPIRRLRKFNLGLGVMIVILSCTAVDAQERPVDYFTFGVYTSEKPTEIFKRWCPILDDASKHLSDKLRHQIKLELVIHKTYEETVDLLIKGEIDFARLAPASYIFAKKGDPDIEIVGKELKKGEEIFYGIIFVRKDSPIKALQDLKGKRFAFGNKRSTIGRFLSQRQLLQAGVTREDLAGYDYLGRHDKVAAAVLAGDFDAGAAKEKTFKKYKNKGVGLREIARHPNVTKNWSARSGIDRKLLRALRKYLFLLDDEVILETCGGDLTGFVKGADEAYDIIREALEDGYRFDPDVGI